MAALHVLRTRTRSGRHLLTHFVLCPVVHFVLLFYLALFDCTYSDYHDHHKKSLVEAMEIRRTNVPILCNECTDCNPSADIAFALAIVLLPLCVLTIKEFD